MVVNIVLMTEFGALKSPKKLKIWYKNSEDNIEYVVLRAIKPVLTNKLREQMVEDNPVIIQTIV